MNRIHCVVELIGRRDQGWVGFKIFGRVLAHTRLLHQQLDPEIVREAIGLGNVQVGPAISANI